MVLRCVFALSLAGLGLAGSLALAQSDLEAFWARGRVRELFIGGLPAAEADLQVWAQNGVNCVTGVKPELAHKCGLKTRSWFTLNYMDSRSTPEDQLKAMAAVNEDGTYRRPFDPLFPTVGQYGWSACVNNPLWIEASRTIFRKKAEAGDDGAHIDFASHYEPCFCTHCEQKWRDWAGKHGLADVDLKQVSHADDVRSRMLLREFRIQCVMDFLGDLRATARAIRPGFGTDGTWHHDSGSTYQWAYGEHFDLMCIEGTTWGPFPPASQQVLWLKLAHALSERRGAGTNAEPVARRPVAMSVTYHLLRNDKGDMFHGRMAPDCVRVTLGEIVSEGGVSWLGLGGPKTGNLLKEHQDAVKAYYALARDIEPLLVDADEVAEIGLVFSPRTFLATDGLRTQIYAIGQALMRAHVPFKILSDARLEPDQLRGLAGVVLLGARALSDNACRSLEVYVQEGGKLLVLGNDAATLTEDWRERAPRPDFAAPPATQAKTAAKTLGKGACHYWLEDLCPSRSLGAAQGVDLNQDKPTKLAVEGWSKAEDVSGNSDGNYSLYVDLIHQDDSPLWGQTAVFATGTHDWEFSRKIIESDKPIKNASVLMLFRNHGGTVWFKDVRFGVWDEAKQQIVANLLGDTYRPKDEKAFAAAPGENASAGAWGPYKEGFEVDNMLDMGLWAKMSAAKGLSVGAMNEPDTSSVSAVMQMLAPLRPATPTLTLDGNGADRVFANVTKAGNRIAVHLINYGAELHPKLPELEQQQTDRSIPATDLVLILRLPGKTLKPDTLQTFFPESKPKVTCEAVDGVVTIRLERLDPYGVLALASE
ncbi:MAG: hypothetical protein A3K19_14625 [Lentisphaerae bacterium RIFOXYB12_FULL_65_16]|nr:MAG: hypothetical protein A3K18_28690 [Lentisphaerae bacterium RIFOXYA12_64_32]OGV87457.1 MAG: hypothetical protein A3K19_14625 [Lentisphaerae bacterium RIFOXYB12_FULL_65_16]